VTFIVPRSRMLEGSIQIPFDAWLHVRNWPTHARGFEIDQSTLPRVPCKRLRAQPHSAASIRFSRVHITVLPSRALFIITITITNIKNDWAFWPVSIPGLIELVLPSLQWSNSLLSRFWVAMEQLSRNSVSCHPSVTALQPSVGLG
jgi:hypothetical protein